MSFRTRRGAETAEQLLGGVEGLLTASSAGEAAVMVEAAHGLASLAGSINGRVTPDADS